MKKFLPILVLSAFVCGAFTNINFNNPEKNLPNHKVLHIGIVVKDIEKSLDRWVTLLNLENRPKVNIAEGHEDNPTYYRGKPSNAKAKLAFLNLDNIRVELIEPIETPSHWKEFLDTKGEGVHHVAFEVKGIGEKYIDVFEKMGYPVIQQGGWNGGEYSYMDGISEESTLGVMIELIEKYNKK